MSKDFRDFYSGIQKRRHQSAFMILALVLLITLFSSCYMLHEADHDCSGESCSVCAMIGQCKNNLEQIGADLAVVFTAAAVIALFCQTLSVFCPVVFKDSLITKKVRLND